MRSARILSATTLIVLISFTMLSAQVPEKKPAIQAFGGADLSDRKASGIVFYNNEIQKPVGVIAIQYGQPLWKADYDDPSKFDAMTKGKLWRLGKDFWTTLDMSLPAKIGGKEVPIGYWYLALRRSNEGAWSLALLDPAKARRLGGIPGVIDQVQPELTIPLITERSESSQDKLTIVVSPNNQDVQRATLKISWGKIQLTSPVEFTLTPGK